MKEEDEDQTLARPGNSTYQCIYTPLGRIRGFPDSSVGKEFTCNAGDPGSIPGSGSSSGEGIGYPLQYSGLQNSINCMSPWGHKDLDTTE